jgi:hypothetical protein
MNKRGFVWFASLIACPLVAGQTVITNDVHAILRDVRVPELPFVAASLVHTVPAQTRIAKAKEVVKVAVGLNPVSTVAIVGAISRVDAATSAAVSETAAHEEPALAADITRAAASVTRGYAGEIVTAVCKVAPTGYRDVALAAGRAAPSESADILRGVGEAIVELKPYIEIELAKRPRRVPSVYRSLNNAERALAADRESSRTGADGNPQGPRERPKSGRPGQNGGRPPPGKSDPPGGRNYARP